MWVYALIFLINLVLINLYFKIADRFNIIDKPNERSSHKEITLRGGGIIYLLGYLTYFFWNDFPLPFFTTGLVMISVVSFWDDIQSLPNRIRLPIHFGSMALLFNQIGLFELPWFIWIAAFVVAVGLINAYNFMDGINGMHGIYTIVVLISVYVANLQVNVLDNELIRFMLISSAVFGIYNFRKKAKCFAGDVGSISVAFMVVYLIYSLIIETGDFSYILFLVVYGADSVGTILHRLWRKENIFKAHRLHLYQVISNEFKQPHLGVSIAYGILQTIASGVILSNLYFGYASKISLGITVLMAFLVIYLFLKIRLLATFRTPIA